MSAMGLTARRKRAGQSHGHVCECTSKRCRERLYFSESLYADVRAKGVIMSRTCAAREGRTVIADYGWFVICATSRAAILA